MRGVIIGKKHALKTKKILNWFACKKYANRNLKKKNTVSFLEYNLEK